MSKKPINNYTAAKRLYFEFALMSSSDDSDFDFEAFNSGQKKKEKKPTEPLLKRSKREGMCLCSGDDSKSESSQTEKIPKSEPKKMSQKIVKSNNDNENLIQIKDDEIVDDFVKNYQSK